MRAGRIEINEIATVGERVGREIVNSEEVRAIPKRKVATSCWVDAHINLSNNDTYGKIQSVMQAHGLTTLVIIIYIAQIKYRH